MDEVDVLDPEEGQGQPFEDLEKTLSKVYRSEFTRYLRGVGFEEQEANKRQVIPDLERRWPCPESDTAIVIRGQEVRAHTPFAVVYDFEPKTKVWCVNGKFWLRIRPSKTALAIAERHDVLTFPIQMAASIKKGELFPLFSYFLRNSTNKELKMVFTPQCTSPETALDSFLLIFLPKVKPPPPAKTSSSVAEDGGAVPAAAAAPTKKKSTKEAHPWELALNKLNLDFSNWKPAGVKKPYRANELTMLEQLGVAETGKVIAHAKRETLPLAKWKLTEEACAIDADHQADPSGLLNQILQAHSDKQRAPRSFAPRIFPASNTLLIQHPGKAATKERWSQIVLRFQLRMEMASTLYTEKPVTSITSSLTGFPEPPAPLFRDETIPSVAAAKHNAVKCALQELLAALTMCKSLNQLKEMGVFTLKGMAPLIPGDKWLQAACDYLAKGIQEPPANAAGSSAVAPAKKAGKKRKRVSKATKLVDVEAECDDDEEEEEEESEDTSSDGEEGSSSVDEEPEGEPSPPKKTKQKKETQDDKPKKKKQKKEPEAPKPKSAMKKKPTATENGAPKKQVRLKKGPPPPQDQEDDVGMDVDTVAQQGIPTEEEKNEVAVVADGMPPEAYTPHDAANYQAKYYRFPPEDDDCVKAVTRLRERWGMQKPVSKYEEYWVYRAAVSPFIAFLLVPVDKSADVLGIFSDQFQFIQEFEDEILKPFSGEYVCDG